MVYIYANYCFSIFEYYSIIHNKYYLRLEYSNRRGTRPKVNIIETVKLMIRLIAIGFKNGSDEYCNNGNNPKKVVIEVIKI